MKLVKTPLKSDNPKDTYLVKVGYEHGDGDSNNDITYKFKGKTEEQMIKYLTKFKEVEQDIENHRCYGIDLPDYIIDARVKIEDKFYIDLEQDNYAKMSTSNYYASMILEEVIYYDHNGQAFKVEMTV